MPSQFCDALFGGECGQRDYPTYLRTGSDGNHNSGLLLTLLRFLDGKAASATDGCEDVKEVDSEHGIEEHLTVALRHAMPLQPAIHDDEVFHLHRETWRFTSAGLSDFPLLLANGHVFQRLEFARPDFDSGDCLLRQRLSLGMALFGQISGDRYASREDQKVGPFAKAPGFFKPDEIASLEFGMARRNSVSAAILADPPVGKRSAQRYREHSFGPITHRSICKEFRTSVCGNSRLAHGWLTFTAETKMTFVDALGL